MKKKLLALVFAAVMGLGGCTDPLELPDPDRSAVEVPYRDAVIDDYRLSTDGMFYWGGYLYLFDRPLVYSTMPTVDVNLSPGTSYISSTLKRVNLQTGVVTNVCPDPLCDHGDTDCPFAGRLEKLFRVDNRLIWWRVYERRGGKHREIVEERARQLCSFDLTTMEWKVLHTQPLDALPPMDSGRYMAVLDDWLYHVQPGVNDAGEPVRQLVKQNLNNGRLEVLDHEAMGRESIDGLLVLFALDGRLYFYDQQKLFSVNAALEDMQVHLEERLRSDTLQTDGEFVYFNRMVGEADTDYTICRLSLAGGSVEELPLASDSPEFVLTGEWIYYQVAGEKEKQTKFPFAQPDPMTGISSFGSTPGRGIWRARHDGSGAEMAMEFSREGDYLGPYRWLPVGDCIYIPGYYRFLDGNADGIVDPDEFINSYYDYSGDSLDVLVWDIAAGQLRVQELPLDRFTA